MMVMKMFQGNECVIQMCMFLWLNWINVQFDLCVVMTFFSLSGKPRILLLTQNDSKYVLHASVYLHDA